MGIQYLHIKFLKENKNFEFKKQTESNIYFHTMEWLLKLPYSHQCDDTSIYKILLSK